jgi:transcriptional regulator with PAS, ATPase and Fis domain
MGSTFFGYVRGAFSGADPRGRARYFESARGGTQFLDEVGELPPAMQTALLRVLEDGSYQRVGSCETRRAECRIIAATHRNLEQLIAEGRFRQDLYFRLKVVQRAIKPLRERREDIGLLAHQFADALGRKHGIESVRIEPEALAALERYRWPGNAREVRNAIEAAVLCSDATIDLDCLPPEIRSATASGAAPARTDFAAPAAEESLASVRDYERQIIISMLRKHRKANRVAQMLGVARSTLYRKFTEFGINPGDYTGAATDADADDAGDFPD